MEETAQEVSFNSCIPDCLTKKTSTHLINGVVADVPMPPSDNNPQNKILTTAFIEPTVLKQIIQDDVHFQKSRKHTSKNLDSNNTVIRNVKDGSIQITYRKMVNNVQPKSNGLQFILPKPSFFENHNDTSKVTVKSTSTGSENITPDTTSPSTLAYTCTSFCDSETSSFSGTIETLPIMLPKMKTFDTTKSCYVCPVSICCTNNTMVTPPLAHSPQNDSITVINQLSYSTVQCPTEMKPECLSNHNLNGFLSNSDTHRLDNMDNMDIDCMYSKNISGNASLYDKDFFNDLLAVTPSTCNSSSEPTKVTSFNAQTLHDVEHGFPQNLFLNSNSEQLRDSNNGLRDSNVSHLHDFIVQTSSNESNDGALLTKHTELIEIIDVSPEISTTSGGNKIILIGSWNAKDARYSCKFGEDVVDAVLIQNGVLRCYSPQHSAEKVKLSVLRNSVVVSKMVDFEFVDPTVDIEDDFNDDAITHDQWMSISSESLVQLLEERVASIVDIMGVGKNIIVPSTVTNTEEKLVFICNELVAVKVDLQFDYHVTCSMTVLHLAAALGYIKLIQLLLNWVETNPNKLIQVEACPTWRDEFHLLPIMWSAAKGHFNTTCVLHQWEEDTLFCKDICGCTVIELAKESGHTSLVSYLDRILKKSNHSASKETSSNSDVTLNSTCCESSIVPNQSRSSDYREGCRTLGKMLAHIQSIISEDHDDDSVDICSHEEESIFETPFTPRLSDEIRNPITAVSQYSPSSPSQISSLQSPFNRQTCETAEFCEFFFKAKTIEKDFAELTLTHEEQNDLYKAANVIQTAYKSYKDRRKQRDGEFLAAVLIQSYYRRYKQYAAFKKMQKGAVLIQNQYRAHREKSVRKKAHAARVIQTYYRRYRKRKHGDSLADYQIRNRVFQQVERKNNRFIQQSTKRFSREFADSFINPDYMVASTAHRDASLFS